MTLAWLVSVLTRATQLAPHHTARERIWLLWGFLLRALYWVSADHLLEAHGHMVLVLEELCVLQDRTNLSFPEGNGGALRCKKGL